MIVKFMGSAAVVGSSYLLGLYFAQKPRFRGQELEQLKKALTIFKGELLYSSYPMEEIFEEISKRTEGSVSMLFVEAINLIKARNEYDISDLWNESIGKISSYTHLNSEDMEYLFSFGRTLGYADKNQQSNNIDLLIDYIELSQKEILKKRGTEEKLYKTLGVSFGLMICIVLF